MDTYKRKFSCIQIIFGIVLDRCSESQHILLFSINNTWWKTSQVHWCNSNLCFPMDAPYFMAWVYCTAFNHSLADGRCLIYWSLVLEEEGYWEFLLPKSPIFPPAAVPLPTQVFAWASWSLQFWCLPASLRPHGFQYFILMGFEAFKNGIQTDFLGCFQNRWLLI